MINTLSQMCKSHKTHRYTVAPLLIYLILIFLAVSLFYINESNASENIHAIFKEADHLYDKKKHYDALNRYEQTISLDPTSTKAYRGIIKCYTALGDPQGAVIYMESFFLENSDKAESCYGLGYALYNIKEYDRAQHYFQRSIKIKPDLAEGWNNCAAICHFITQDYQKAREYYNKAIHVSRKTGNNRVLAVAKENLAHLPESVALKPVSNKLTLEAFLNKFISMVDEQDDTGIRNLVLGQKKVCEQAMDWALEKAMRSSVEGRKEDEISTLIFAQLLEKAYTGGYNISLLTEKLDAYNQLDDEKKKEIIEGETFLKDGFRQNQIGLFKDAQNKYEKALKCFENSMDKSRAGLAYVYMGDAYRKSKHYLLAEKAYQKGLNCFNQADKNEEKASVLSSLGITCFRLDKHQEALVYLKRAQKIYGQLENTEAEKKVEKNIALITADRKGPSVKNLK